jgi:hypothetical protein
MLQILQLLLLVEGLVLLRPNGRTGPVTVRSILVEYGGHEKCKQQDLVER